MPPGKRVSIITYNGVDGACAAAMALLRFPSAEVAVASPASIGRTLGSPDEQRLRLAATSHGLGDSYDHAERPSQVKVGVVNLPQDWLEL
jgi:hypothetical protein